MSAAAGFFIIFILVTVSSTFPSPIADCPDSSEDSEHGQPIISDSAPPLIPNNDSIIPEAPLMPPSAHTAAAPIISYPDIDSTVSETPTLPSTNNNNIIAEAPLLPHPSHTPQPEQSANDGVEPFMQPSPSTDLNENESEGGEQLGADNPNENKSTGNTGFAGATRAIGGGVGARPLVDNTPFDSASTTTYGFMSFSSCIALMFLSVLI